MKLEYDIRYFNPEIHQDISRNPDSTSRDISISPFLKENNNSNKKIIEKEELIRKYKRFKEIVSESNLNKFIIQCIIADFCTILLFTIELVDATMEKSEIFPSIISILKYIFSMVNGILGLDFLIVQNEYTNNQKKLELENTYKKFYTYPPPADSSHYVYLNPPNAILKNIYYTKFWMWLFKFILYLIYMSTQKNLNFANYLELFLIMVENYQYNLLKFYYHTILRAEFNKAKIDRIEAKL